MKDPSADKIRCSKEKQQAGKTEKQTEKNHLAQKTRKRILSLTFRHSGNFWKKHCGNGIGEGGRKQDAGERDSGQDSVSAKRIRDAHSVFLQGKRNGDGFQALEKIQKNSACSQWKCSKKQGGNDPKKRLLSESGFLPGFVERVDTQNSSYNFSSGKTKYGNGDWRMEGSVCTGYVKENHKEDSCKLFKQLGERGETNLSES